MYFITPTRHVAEATQAIEQLPNLLKITIADIADCDPTMIVIADVQDFIQYKWSLPTIVVAFNHEGEALAKAWQMGALAGWIWGQLPERSGLALQKIEAQYKRNQDSRDLPSAAALQQRLLPQPIALTNYKIETFFKPSAYLSGDWYDYWPLEDNPNQVLFYLADVSGHGVTSSLLTSWMAAFHGRSNSPLDLVQQLNRMLLQENIEKHITIVAGLVDLSSNQLTWVNAGHYPPPIVFESEHPPRIFSSSSFPLGLTEDLQLETQHIQLESNARFIICSDGALEPYSGGLNEQFKQLLKDLHSNSFHAPEHVADDIAILSFCRINSV